MKQLIAVVLVFAFGAAAQADEVVKLWVRGGVWSCALDNSSCELIASAGEVVNISLQKIPPQEGVESNIYIGSSERNYSTSEMEVRVNYEVTKQPTLENPSVSDYTLQVRVSSGVGGVLSNSYLYVSQLSSPSQLNLLQVNGNFVKTATRNVRSFVQVGPGH